MCPRSIKCIYLISSVVFHHHNLFIGGPVLHLLMGMERFLCTTYNFFWAVWCKFIVSKSLGIHESFTSIGCLTIYFNFLVMQPLVPLELNYTSYFQHQPNELWWWTFHEHTMVLSSHSEPSLLSFFRGTAHKWTYFLFDTVWCSFLKRTEISRLSVWARVQTFHDVMYIFDEWRF